MTTIRINQLEETLKELEQAFEAAHPFFDKFLLPYLQGLEDNATTCVKSSSLSHQERDAWTGRLEQTIIFRKAVENAYYEHKKQLESKLREERTDIENKDRAQAKAAGGSNRHSDPDPFAG
jgi:hypothetical protein